MFITFLWYKRINASHLLVIKIIKWNECNLFWQKCSFLHDLTPCLLPTKFWTTIGIHRNFCCFCPFMEFIILYGFSLYFLDIIQYKLSFMALFENLRKERDSFNDDIYVTVCFSRAIMVRIYISFFSILNKMEANQI